MSRTAIYAAAAAIGVSFLGVACTTDYQAGKDDPAFGDPNALAGQRPPGPSNTVADNAGGGGQPLCVKNGGTLVQETCLVSLKDGILKEFGTAGCASAACHGGTTPLYEPRIEPSDGPAMWQEWQTFTLTNGKPYINPCSKDPAESTLVCNVSATGTCGSLMPKGQQGLPPNIVALLDTWVKCGAPNN